MAEQTKLSKFQELFEAEDNLEKMLKAKSECVKMWNRDIKSARQVIQSKRNELRSGKLQLELKGMLKNESD